MASPTYLSLVSSTPTQVQATTTLSVTVSSGSNRGMIVIPRMRYDTGANSAASVVFNGSESLTRACRLDQNYSGTLHLRSEIWYLVAPSVTTANVVVTWSTAGTADVQDFDVILLTDMLQAAPLDAILEVGGTANPFTGTITTGVADSLIISHLSVNDVASLTAGNGQTSRSNRSILSVIRAGVATLPLASAGAQTISYTNGAVDAGWSLVAASFKPVAGATIQAQLLAGKFGNLIHGKLG